MNPKISNLLPISFVVLGFWILFPVTSDGIINQQQTMQEPSVQLQEKKTILAEKQASCGKDSLCRIYGDRLEINEENSLKFFAFVNTLRGKGENLVR